MDKISVVVVGNCQARPISHFLEKLNKNISVLDVVIVHLASDSDEDKYTNNLSKADYIIAQQVSDDYPCKFVRTENLKKTYGEEKVITILNLFLRDGLEDWFYLRTPGGTVRGPLGDYHNKLIFLCWKLGLSVEKCKEVIAHRSNDFLIDYNFSESVNELKRREVLSDVGIVDALESDASFFHTFNHPNNNLLIEYSNRISVMIDPTYQDQSDKFTSLPKVNEALGQITLPKLYPQPLVDNSEQLDSSCVQVGGERFRLEDFIEPFYWEYDCNPNLKLYDLKDSIRLTVNYNDKAVEPLNLRCRPQHPRVVEKYLRTPEVKVDVFTNVVSNFSPHRDQVSINALRYEDKNAYESLGHVLDLTTLGAVVYTHWIFDLTPKVKVVEDLGFDITSFDKIIVNSFNSSFQRDTLSRLGIPAEKIVALNKLPNKEYICKSRVGVSNVRQNLATPVWVLRYTRELFKPEPVQGDFSRVYISRRKASRRKVINEDAVERLLRNFNFNIVYAEDFSISEMAFIMKQAKVVVGPHGAGLANIAFCSKGTKVLELFSFHLSQEYWLFSERLGLDYSCLHSLLPSGEKALPTPEDYTERFKEVNGMDIAVDLDQLEGWLNKIM